jgi:ribosomal protein L30
MVATRRQEGGRLIGRRDGEPAAEAAAEGAMTMAEAKKIKITQTGSPIGRTDDQLATLKGLGLNKRHRSRVLETRRRCAA